MNSGGLRTKGITKIGTIEHPLITVVTVVFNGEKTLEQTILSVVNQTYDNIEYIIIDGKSSDKTLDIIKKYEGKIDYWQSEPDKGIYDAMNKSLKIARGDYLIFMGADDVFFNENVLMTVKSCFREAEKIYYGNVKFSTSQKIYDFKFSKYKLILKNICHQSIFYSKSVYMNYSYNTKYKIYADWDYNLRIRGKVEFEYIPNVITIFCDVGSSLNRDKLFLDNKTKIVKEIFGNWTVIIFALLKPFLRVKYKIEENLRNKKCF